MRQVLVVTASVIGVTFFASAAPLPSQPAGGPVLHFAPSQAHLVPHAPVRLGRGITAGPVSRPAAALPDPPAPPPPPTPREALEKGVLIVVSLSSQRAFVFKNGAEWDSTEVSTGKPGNETPEGAFPILQKKVHHRSTLYDGAPMPYMQRLTWDGVALHSGRVPGYPASHGCIRLPKDFAEKLYRITGFSSTIVMVTGQPLESAKDARALA